MPATAPIADTRFRFGRNWASFLRVLNDERVALARRSLSEMLKADSLAGKTFLDIGSGSGLFSLAARLLGARVHSFDFDAEAVECARELKRRFCPSDDRWSIEQGSVLDRGYLETLGRFDIVYSWGVLHHTGAMYEAIDNASRTVARGGQLFIAIYNDQGVLSRFWTWEKRTYNRLPVVLRPLLAGPVQAAVETKIVLGFLKRRDPLGYVRYWTRYASVSARGMSRWHDIVDWLGGYPFEVATPAAIVTFLGERGFGLDHSIAKGVKSGCNQFVFRRTSG